MFLMTDVRTISMDGSVFSWDDVEVKTKKLNMDRSEYVQKLIETDLRKKKNRFNIRDIVMLLCLALLFVILIVVR